MANSKMRSRYVAALILGYLWTVGSSGFVIHANADDGADRYEFVIAGWSAGRQKLRSGQFRFRGKVAVLSAVDEDGRETDNDEEMRTEEIGVTEGFCAFDYDKKWFRFDRDAPKRSVDDSGRRAVERIGGQYARTPEKSIRRKLGDDTVSIQPSHAKLPTWLKPFDIRVLGASHVFRLEAADLSQLTKGFENRRTSLVSSENGVYRVEWILGTEEAPSFKRTIWFRESHDFWPDRIEVKEYIQTYTIGPKGREDHNHWGPVDQSMDLTVGKFADEWVPKTVCIMQRGSGKETLEFTWEKLNEPIDENLFEPAGFDLTNAKVILDNRDGQMIPITKELIPQAPSVVRKAKVVMPSRRRSYSLFVAANLIVFAVVGAFILKGQRANATKPSARG